MVRRHSLQKLLFRPLTVWVDNGDNVDVVAIQSTRNDSIAVLVALDDLVRQILDRLSGFSLPLS